MQTHHSAYRSFLLLPLANKTNQSQKDALIELIKYESIALVLRQCYHALSSVTSTPISNHANTPSHDPRNHHSMTKRRNLLPYELSNLKLRCRCKKCGTFRHWASDHLQNCVLHPDTPSNDVTGGVNPHENPDEVHLNMTTFETTSIATVEGSTILTTISKNGSLAEYSAP